MATDPQTVRAITRKLGGGPLEVKVRVELPRLIQTRTRIRKLGPVTVTTRVKTLRLPGRSGGYTLTKQQAIGLLERAMRLLGDLDGQLDQVAAGFAGEARLAEAQSADAQSQREAAIAEADRITVYCDWLQQEAGRLLATAHQHSQAGTTARDGAEAAAARGDAAAALRHARDATVHEAEAIAHREAAETAAHLAKELADERVPRLWQAAEQLAEEAAAHTGRAQALTELAGAAAFLRGEVTFAARQVGRRLVFARGTDEGAAAALDDAALVIIAAADLVEGYGLLTTDTTGRARSLALESRK